MIFSAILAFAFTLTNPGIGFASSSNNAGPGLGVRLTEVSSADASNPRARLYVIDRVAPGKTLTKTIEISNNTVSAQTVYCYSSAASILDGKFQGAEGTKGNELTSWMSFSKSTLHMKRGGLAKVAITFRVPVDASESERYGAIWAEIRSTNAANGITSINRVGIRVYLSVGAGGEPASAFTIKSISVKRNSDRTPELDAQVENIGGRALDIYGFLTLSDGPGGTSAGPFQTILGTSLAIGNSGIIKVTLPKEIPDGPWLAKLTLTSGLVTNSITAKIIFPAIGSTVPVPLTNALNWPLLIMVLVGSLGIAGSTAAIQRARIKRRR